MKYEFEFFTPENGQYPTISLVDLSSNTEAENHATRWLKEKRAEAYRQIHPLLTKSERKEILSGLALLHVSVSRPVDRNERGEIEIYDRRRNK